MGGKEKVHLLVRGCERSDDGWWSITAVTRVVEHDARHGASKRGLDIEESMPES